MRKENKDNNVKITLKQILFILISVIIILILIGLIILTFKNKDVLIEKYNSKYISFNYDNNFIIVEDKDQIELNNEDKSALIIVKKLDYTQTSKNKNKDDLAASLSYQVIEEENNYIEIYNNYEEKNNKTYYYYLYENYKEERQVEVITIFDENYIYMIIYSAKNKDFDLYNESIEIIKDSIES